MKGGFEQWWSQLGRKPFTPDDNRRLEALIRHGKSARERYWAWIIRTSWGNHELYCCKWTGKDIDNPPPLNQSDAADAIGVSRNTISKLTLEAIKEGRLQEDLKQLIVPRADPKTPVILAPPEDKAYALIRERFFTQVFPQYGRELDEIHAAKEQLQAREKEIEKVFRGYWKDVTRSGDTLQTPVTGPLFDSGDNSSPGSSDNSSPTPVTPSEASHTDSLTPRAHASENIKQLNKQQQQGASPITRDDVVVVAKKLHEYGRISEGDTRNFLARCAKACGVPACRRADVVAYIDAMRFGRNVRDRLAVILTKVPEGLAAQLAHRTEPHPVETKCWNCGRPLTGYSVNGACAECVEANHTAKGAGND